MHILFLNHNVAWRGGTFFRAYHFARHLARRGHRPVLFTISPTARLAVTREQRDGVELVYCPDLLWGRGRSGWDPWNTIRRCGLVRRDCWDVIHAWDSRPAVVLPALFAMNRTRGHKTRLVMDWCDWWGRGGTESEREQAWMRLVGPLETFFEENFRLKADGTTVISQALARRALGLGVPADRICLLPQGCDKLDPLMASQREEARGRLGLGIDAEVILVIGALMRSDAQLLFESLTRLFERKPNGRVFMIGKHNTRVPSTLKLHGRLVETGFVSDAVLQDYMVACDALLTPLADTIASRARWPSKVNPVLALGRAVVITRVGDLPAMLEREQAAVVTEPSPECLADSAVALLTDRILRERCEANGRRVAVDVLDWTLLAHQLEEFYLALLDRPSSVEDRHGHHMNG